MANQSIEISLQDVNLITDIESQLDINADDNEAKTSFTDNDVVKIRFYSSSDINYSFGSTFGTVKKIGSNIQFQQIDYLTFINTTEEKLTYFPKIGALTYEWIGVSLGAVIFNGNSAKINTAGYGILKVTYNTKYDLLQLVIPKIKVETKAMVWVKQAETSTTTEIDYGLRSSQVVTGQTTIRRAPFELLVLDYTTGSPLPAVRVSLNGMYKGYTGVDGKIFLGNLAVGNYRLKMTKTNYFSSSNDGLNNDSFEIVFADTELIRQ